MSKSIPILCLALTTTLGLSSPSGDVDGASDCVSQYTFVGVEKLDLDGSRSGLDAPSLEIAVRDWKADRLAGRVFHFAGAANIEEIVEPYGWSRAKANNDQLSVFGIEPRPDSPDAAQSWLDSVARLTPSDPAGFCSSRAGVRAGGTYYSTNWGGGFSTNGTTNVDTYYSAEARWYQPHYQAVCPAASKNSLWSGLGGWNRNLIQAGTDLGSGSVDAAYWFWEVIDQSNSLNSVAEQIVSGLPIYAGDFVGAKTAFFSGRARFTLASWTQGLSKYIEVPSVEFGSRVVPAQNYYDGSTADYISEATYGGSAPGGLFYLRKPTTNISFPYAVANGHAISQDPTGRIFTQRVGVPSANKQTTTFDGVHAWHQNWLSCS